MLGMSFRFSIVSGLFALLLVVTAAPGKPQAAQTAESFIDAIGVNTHFGNAAFTQNAYANKQIGAKLAALGVRHIRDHSYNDIGVQRVDALFKQYGIRATLVLGETTRSPADIVKLLKAHPAYEAVEGLNEPDFTPRTYKSFADNRATNDYAATRAFQDELHAALKADPKTKDIPVLSPALGRSNRSQFLMPIQFDVAAMHRYAWEGKAAMEPGFLLDDAIADMKQLRGDKPLWATESGYYNEPAAHPRAVPEDVAGVYMPRLVGEFFWRGVARTYIYELADQGTDKSAREQNFGLLRHDMTEKPAYVALRNLIALLREPKAPKSAAPFTPEALDFELAPPADAKLQPLGQNVLRKRDGTYVVLLWQQVSVYDAAKKEKLENPPIKQTVELAQSFNVKLYLPNESTTPTKTYEAVKTFELAVPDRVIAIELTRSK
jgi:hypothetical protein